jgi:hypothetical protein
MFMVHAQSRQRYGFSKSLKNKLWFMLNGAEVAQLGRALDSTASVVEGEAEDRVVAGSNPALGTTIIFCGYVCYTRKGILEKCIP